MQTILYELSRGRLPSVLFSEFCLLSNNLTWITKCGTGSVSAWFDIDMSTLIMLVSQLPIFSHQISVFSTWYSKIPICCCKSLMLFSTVSTIWKILQKYQPLLPMLRTHEFTFESSTNDSLSFNAFKADSFISKRVLSVSMRLMRWDVDQKSAFASFSLLWDFELTSISLNGELFLEWSSLVRRQSQNLIKSWESERILTVFFGIQFWQGSQVLIQISDYKRWVVIVFQNLVNTFLRYQKHIQGLEQ